MQCVLDLTYKTGHDDQADLPACRRTHRRVVDKLLPPFIQDARQIGLNLFRCRRWMPGVVEVAAAPGWRLHQ